MFAFDSSFDYYAEASTNASSSSMGLRDVVRLVLMLKLISFLYGISLYALTRFQCRHSQSDGEDNNSSELNCKGRQMSFADACCPRRRARFYKCMARRNHHHQHNPNQSNNSTNNEQCQESDNKCCISSMVDCDALAESAVHYAKLHLPPPLPFHKRHKKTRCTSLGRSTSTSTVETTRLDDEEDHSHSDSSSSSSSTSTKVTSVPEEPTTEVDGMVEGCQKSVPSKRVRLSTPLIDLARMQQWDTILRQQGSIRKRDVRHRDSDGLNSLHWACAGSPPVEVVEALLRVSPSAAHKMDNDGSTALHFATHYSASLAVVQTLLKAYPEAIRVQDCHGRSPMYHAVEKRAGIDVLHVLAKADPSMLTVPCLSAKIREQQREREEHTISRPMAARSPLFLIWSHVVMDRQTRLSRKGKIWDKAQALLEVAYRHHTNRSKEHSCRFVSATIAMDLYLPDQVLAMAIESCPEQLRIADEQTGQLPLAHAAASTQYCLDRTHIMLRALLEAYPQAAAVADKSGRTSLHLAAETGKPWSVQGRGILQLLFQANPDAMNCSSFKGLSPALLAATAASPSTKTAVVSNDGMRNVKDEATDIIKNNDPFGLLSAKHHQRMQRLQMTLPRTSASPGNTSQKAVASDEEQLETIYELVRTDPSAVTVSKTTK